MTSLKSGKFHFYEKSRMPVKNIWLHVNFAKTTGKDGKFRFAKYWLIDWLNLLIDWLVDYDKIDKMTATNIFLIIIVQEMP